MLKLSSSDRKQATPEDPKVAEQRRKEALKQRYQQMRQLDLLKSQLETKPRQHDHSDADPFLSNQTSNDCAELGLPTVIILVSDNVKLIRNNSVPMLQVQLEIIQNTANYDSDMCQLGLNDVVYLVPEFTPSEYHYTYPKVSTGNEFQEFQPFFEHYSRFDIRHK